MTEPSQILAARIQELLADKVQVDPQDIVELVPVPHHGDRTTRLKTLEDALQDFDGYLLKVRPRTGTDYVGTPVATETIAKEKPLAKQAPSKTVASPLRTAGDGVYLPDGKLNVPFLLQNAEILFSNRDYSLARNLFKAIFQSGNRPATALNGIGRCFEAEGKFEEARASYDESIAYQPNLDAFQHVASLLIRQKKDEPAAEMLERALQFKDLPSPTRYELHKAAGNCWLRAQRPQEAQKHYERAIGLNPSVAEIRANLGALQLQSGKITEAQSTFQEALAIDPRHDKALAGLASCFLALGDRRMAHDYFAKSLEVELNNPTAIYHLVKCAYDLKIFATAARVLEEYVQIAPVNANLLYSLAGLQFHMGRVDDAATTTRKILEICPDHAAAGELGELIERMNRRSDER